ncbi:MAG: response regulator transcription factor [Rhodospirillales bacterium]
MKFLIADDHGLFRAGIAELLSGMAEKPALRQAASLEEAEAALAAEDIDLVLLDLFMPGMEQPGAIARLRAAAPATPLLVVSASQSAEDVREVLAAGAAGFITKAVGPELLIEGLTRLLETGEEVVLGVDLGAEPRLPLTDRQHQILSLAAEGLSNREIGRDLGITEGTVKIHVSSALKALGARNRTEAAKMIKGDGSRV